MHFSMVLRGVFIDFMSSFSGVFMELAWCSPSFTPRNTHGGITDQGILETWLIRGGRGPASGQRGQGRVCSETGHVAVVSGLAHQR